MEVMTMLARVSVLAALLAGMIFMPAVAQTVYKCSAKDGTPIFQQTPCHPNDKPIKIEGVYPDRHKGDVIVEDSNCLGERGWLKATGYLANHTKDVKTVDLTTTFLKDGTVVESLTRTYTVSAFDKVPFDIQGGRYYANSCDYHWKWH